MMENKFYWLCYRTTLLYVRTN